MGEDNSTVKDVMPEAPDKGAASGGCLRLGEFLLQNGIITSEQLEEALESQKYTGRKIGSILVDMGILSEEQLCEELSRRLHIPFFDLANYIIDPKVVQMVPEHLCERYRLICIKKTGNRLTVAMFNPFDEMALEDMRILTGLKIKPVLATPSSISHALNGAFGTIDYAASLLEAMVSTSGRVDIKDRLYKMLEAAENAKKNTESSDKNPVDDTKSDE